MKYVEFYSKETNLPVSYDVVDRLICEFFGVKPIKHIYGGPEAAYDFLPCAIAIADLQIKNLILADDFGKIAAELASKYALNEVGLLIRDLKVLAAIRVYFWVKTWEDNN